MVTPQVSRLLPRGEIVKFFIDTSVLINAGPNLSSRKLGVLLDQLRSKQVAMVTCQVVIDECVNKFSETIARRRIEILHAVNELKKAVGQEFLISIPDYQLEEWVSSYRSTIEQIFEGEGSYILPYPEVSHEEIVHRAMRGTKPYNKGKKDGYRDTLIWFSILEELKNEPDKDICIVTANLSDFGQIVDGRAIPEEQLTLDLTSRGYRKDSLKLLTSLEAIIKIHIEYQISMLGEVKEAILSKSWSERKLEQDVESAIEDYFLAFPLYDYPLNTLPSGSSIDYQ